MLSAIYYSVLKILAGDGSFLHTLTWFFTMFLRRIGSIQFNSTNLNTILQCLRGDLEDFAQFVLFPKLWKWFKVTRKLLLAHKCPVSPLYFFLNQNQSISHPRMHRNTNIQYIFPNKSVNETWDISIRGQPLYLCTYKYGKEPLIDNWVIKILLAKLWTCYF